ncbi:hypothetical protein NBH08_23055 [Faecalicatena sp. BF-R-105]|nr:hypothetical protein [Faecalicatena sp. BF-R-105]
MQDYFKDTRGWLAFIIIVATILAVGTTRFLSKNINVCLLALIAVSILVVIILSKGETDH